MKDMNDLYLSGKVYNFLNSNPCHRDLHTMRKRICIGQYVCISIPRTSRSTVRMVREKPQTLQESAAHAVGMIVTKPVLDIFYKYMQTRHISAEEKRDLESFITRTAEAFDELIPKPLHEIVTQYSLQCLPFDFMWSLEYAKNKLDILDIVLRSHTKRFKITKLPGYMHDVLYRSLQRLNNLQYLKLSYTNWNENLIHVTSAIKDMKKLESFKCFHCCDKIVEVLGAYCPLRKLDICESRDVTDLSLPHILSMRNLEELNISFSDISENSCFQILNGLPHLKTISCNHINSVLAGINDDSVQMPFESIGYYCYTQEDVVNLTKYCPLIRKLDISIEKYFRGSSVNSLPVHDLSVLAALSHLKSLTVYSLPLKYSIIKSFLHSNGHQLIELDLSYFRCSSTEVENEIKRLCPNLKSLQVNYF